MNESDVPHRAIAESTYDWETWVDEHGVVRWVNAAVERLTGYSPEACLAMEDFPLALVHTDDRPDIARALADAANGAAGNDLEFRVNRRDGSIHWLAISFAPLQVAHGIARGYRTSIRDIDARKAAEERLREAERRASRSAREQAELLAALSHELRSPLHCIAGYGELIARLELDAELRRYVTIVDEQSAAALRLVEDLLHYVSLAESHATLQRTSFDLAALVEREAFATRPRVSPGVLLDVIIRPGTERVHVGDPDRIRQVVANLLSNAARFTESGAIELVLASSGRGVSIEVRDTGIGMDDALLARVREPFVQGAPTSASRGGVGLGLAIVDRLMTAMQGNLEISSAPGRGTTVTMTLPRSPIANDGDASATRDAAGTPDTGRDAEAPPPEALGANLESLRVLVVDDLEPARELLVAMFRTLGVAPDAVPNGERALALIARVRYDLVVLDFHMPGMSGVDVAMRARAAHPNTGVPTFVLLTANVLADAFADPGAHGVDVVLAKPLRLAQARALAVRVAHSRGAPAPLALVDPSAPTGDVDHAIARELRGIVGPDGTTLLARTLVRIDQHVTGTIERVRGGCREASIDSATLAQDVHSVKGLVASVGAVHCAAIAQALIRALEAHAPAIEVLGRLDALEHAYAEARRVLSAEL